MTEYKSDYSFFNSSDRIGFDNSCRDMNDLQNTLYSSHLLQNFYLGDTQMKGPIAFATQQIGINYKGSFNTDYAGSNVDDSSNLLIGTINTHPRSRISLFQRPFATTPFLGRGSSCPILESQLQQGDTVTNKKSVNTLSEKSFIKYSNTPMLASLKADMGNSSNFIETDADPTFIRGGLDSRDLQRDVDFNTQHSKYQYN